MKGDSPTPTQRSWAREPEGPENKYNWLDKTGAGHQDSTESFTQEQIQNKYKFYYLVYQVIIIILHYIYTHLSSKYIDITD